MFRTARQIAPLLSSLLFSAATAASVGIATGAIAGCADDADPATHVKKLQDVSTRSAAVSRLIQFYEDRMTQDKGDRNGPLVKPLLETIVPPMTERCVAGDVDDRSNTKLVKFLSDARDPKAEACFIKTLKGYKPDTNEEEVRYAARAVGVLKLKPAAGPLMEVFTKIHASKPKAQAAYRDIHDAMVQLQDPSWESQLIGYLDRPIADPKDANAVNDEMFWQITSAELLGWMKSSAAVKPLLKLMLSPYKGGGQGDAVLALVKIGKPAIEPAVALLKGQDKDLVEYAKGEALRAAAGEKAAEKAANFAYVGPAALVLATIGREETAVPLVAALNAAEDGLAKAIMARELTKVPRSPQTIKAFQDTYEKLPITLSIPNSRGGAREVLLDVAPNFFDASFVPWIAKTVKDLKGEEADLAPIRERAMEAILKLSTKDQTKYIDDLAGLKAEQGTLGKGYEKEIKLAKELLSTCGDKLDCFLGKLTDPAVQGQDKQSVAIKAAYQIGVIGGADVPTKIMAVYPKIMNDGIRFAALTVVDVLSPKGNAAIAAQLQKLVDDAAATKDTDKQRFSPTLKQFLYRLNARAQ